MEKWIPSVGVLKAAEKCPPEWITLSGRWLCRLMFWEGSAVVQMRNGDLTVSNWPHGMSDYELQAILLKFWTDKCDAALLEVTHWGGALGSYTVHWPNHGAAPAGFLNRFDTRLEALAAAVLALAEKEDAHAK